MRKKKQAKLISMGASGKEIFAPETRDADMNTQTWYCGFPAVFFFCSFFSK